ncbi:MAG: polysaccharide biosynthesis C-terminal domain-containing protein [Lachnospiraceae bacterium]|nr:polysaccharide biosynthesis C-terminal domain-containing protein [Lachnospiraceae bacterium]
MFKNSLVSFACQLVILALGMIIPRILMVGYGSDTNGLTNTVTQIFTYMSLLGAGIGQATQNSLYKYLGDDDRKGISLVMSAARRYYRRVSLIYGILIIVVSAVLPYVINSDVPAFTIFLYVAFGGATSLIALYFTSLWIVFLNASGKGYISNIITLFGRILLYAVIILLSLNMVDIAYIQIGSFLVSLIPLTIYYLYMKKHYSWIDYRQASGDEKLPDRNSYVIMEVSWTVFSSTDMIILSAFISTKMASVYATYSMVFAALETLIDGVYYSVKYLLGYTFHNDRKEYAKIHDIFNSAFVGGTVILLSVCYWLIIPFVRLYTNGVEDVNYVMTWVPLCFCIVKLLSRSRMVAGNLGNIAGYAKPIGYLSLLEAALNILLSVLLVRRFGIYGVLFATAAALVIKVVYVNYLAEKKIINRKSTGTIGIFLANYAVFALTVFLQHKNPLSIDSPGEFIISGVILMCIYVPVGFAVNLLADRSFGSAVKDCIERRPA